MKADKFLCWAASVSAGLALCGCGHDSYVAMSTPPPPSMTPPPPPVQPMPMDYTTADVLAKARASSETDDPFAVNGGVVVISPGDDQTSDPQAVDTN